MPPEAVIVAVILAIGVGGALYLYFEHQRRLALTQAAANLGLTYTDSKDDLLPTQFACFRETSTGSDRYATDFVRGEFDGFPVLAFTYHYQTSSTDSDGKRQSSHHYFRIFAVALPGFYPLLTITPEGILSKVAQAFGYDDIDFESAEFSRAFCVRSPNKRFAYDFCHPQMIEYLLAHRDLRLGIDGDHLASIQRGRLAPDSLHHGIARITAIRHLLPDHLKM